MLEQPGQPEPTEPQPSPAPKDQEAQPEPTPATGKFAGKSATEIAKAYEELEKTLGKQAGELGNLRAENDQIKTYVQQVIAATQQQRPPEQPEKPLAFDWEKPEDAVSNIAAREAAKVMDKRVGDLYRTVRIQQAMSMGQFAQESAKTQHPHLFQGDTSQQVGVFLRDAIQKGADPGVIENPQIWATVAWVMNGMKSNFGAGGPVNPVSPDGGEQPRGTKSREIEGETIQLTYEQEEAIKKFGFKPDEIVKEIREEKRKKR